MILTAWRAYVYFWVHDRFISTKKVNFFPSKKGSEPPHTTLKSD